MSSSDVEKKIQQLSPEKRILLEQRLRQAAQSDKDRIPRRKPQDPRVLSFAQQQLWLVDQLSPSNSAYNVPYPIRIRGVLNVDALRNALNTIVGRHEVLRTLFVNFKGQPLPVVTKQWNVELKYVDLRNVAQSERHQQLLRLLKQDAGRPFDLARDIKLRGVLYQLDDQECVFLHVSHHISWDLRSKVIFYEELGPLYGTFCEGKSLHLPELPIQYADYALWQRRRLQGELLDKLNRYWKQQLAGAASRLDLPTDRPRPPVQTLRGAKYPVMLSADLLQRAKRVSGQSGVTLYILLLAIFKVFLLCYTGECDISVGSPFAGRSPETNTIIGMFINTLVLRTKISLEVTFREILARVRETTVAAIAHQELPFEKIVEAVRPPRDPSRNTLFQVNFRLQSATAVPLELPGLITTCLDTVDNDAAKFDLALELPSSSDSRGYFEYNSDLFNTDTIERMAVHFSALMETLLEEPNSKLTDMPLVRRIGEESQR